MAPRSAPAGAKARVPSSGAYRYREERGDGMRQTRIVVTTSVAGPRVYSRQRTTSWFDPRGEPADERPPGERVTIENDLDLNDVTVGTVAHLPVWVPGANFATGRPAPAPGPERPPEVRRHLVRSRACTLSPRAFRRW